MKIKIKDEWFDTGDQTPIMLVLTEELEKYNRRISEMQTLSTNWDFISKDLQKDVDSAIRNKIKELKDEMYDKFKDLTAPLDEKV